MGVLQFSRTDIFSVLSQGNPHPLEFLQQEAQEKRFAIFPAKAFVLSEKKRTFAVQSERKARYIAQLLSRTATSNEIHEQT